MRWQNVGVREFRDQATTLFRKVREEKVGLIITLDGEPSVVIRPLSEEDRMDIQKESTRNLVDSMKEIARKSAGKWPKALSAVDAVRSERRDY